jgi:hypothetical protein
MVFLAGSVPRQRAAYVWIQGPLENAIGLEGQRAANVGRIMTLDEVLTMSARMAAAAHAPAYEARYNANVDELDALIKATVAARTAELAQRNRGMRLVLDNVAQGFVTIDLAGVIAPERSAIVDRWFGAPAPAATLSDHLRAHAPDFAQWLALGLDELRDGALLAELVIAQLPGRFTAGAQTFDVAYSPIAQGAALDSLLVIVSEVTAKLATSAANGAARAARSSLLPFHA